MIIKISMLPICLFEFNSTITTSSRYLKGLGPEEAPALRGRAVSLGEGDPGPHEQLPSFVKPFNTTRWKKTLVRSNSHKNLRLSNKLDFLDNDFWNLPKFHKILFR